jgi:hypothetical protein
MNDIFNNLIRSIVPVYITNRIIQQHNEMVAVDIIQPTNVINMESSPIYLNDIIQPTNVINMESSPIYLNDIIQGNADPMNENGSLDTQIYDLPAIRRARKCGYCRCEHHIVTRCNDPEILTIKQLIRECITTQADLEIILPVINHLRMAELKVVCCQYGIAKFRSRHSIDELRTILVNYIERRHAQIRESRNRRRLIYQRSQLQALYQEIYQPLMQELNNPNPNLEFIQESMTPILNSRSIQIIPTDAVDGEDATECPICIESITTDGICETNCHHKFCKCCIYKTILSAPIHNTAVCPMCRSHITTIHNYSNVE